ncbi:DUF6221 family protein [Streptomyces atratus]|uniref:DUF6221 family protein n=1 Tax=Streptomyces atratus TaxID=1893 RepID=UPI002F9117F0
MTDAPIRLDEVYAFCVERLGDDENRAERGYYSDAHWERFTAEAHLGAWRAWRTHFPRDQWDVKANDQVSEAALDAVRERIGAHEKDRSARMLADVAFKRTLLAEHEPSLVAAVKGDEMTPLVVCGIDGDDCPFTRGLAALYDDHPDYEESWRL